MTKPVTYGQSDFGPTKILPPVEFDLTGDHPGPFGKSDLGTQVTLLPPVTLDLTPVPRPALRLEIRLRASATPSAIARGILRLYTALNDLELSLGGSGLKFDDRASEPGTNGTISLVFLSEATDDAKGRLEQLLEIVKRGGRTILPEGGVIESCQMSFVLAA